PKSKDFRRKKKHQGSPNMSPPEQPVKFGNSQKKTL
ncbi:hypothetical protein AVDCRST_MAG84-1315, partial [uncultured Microcoleus sp.]